jgi:hypothetical protein
MWLLNKKHCLHENCMELDCIIYKSFWIEAWPYDFVAIFSA